jgi:ATP-dependent helicase/nuclease subunit A
LTRAEEKLIVVTCFSEFKKKIEALQDMSFVENGRMRPYYFKNTNKYSDWLFAEDFCHNSKPFLDYLTKNEKNEYIHTSFENADATEEVAALPDDRIVNLLKDNYSNKYPYAELLSVEAKASVTDIVHKSDETKYQFTSKPEFMNDGGMSAAGRGTSTHKFMQFCDYEMASVSVKDECDRLYESGYLTLEESNAVNISAVETFFSSNLYTRIKKSPLVKKEMNFLSEFPANFVHKELSSNFHDEKIIVQGAVDLLFIEDDEIVIVDFKTDRNKDEDELVAAYAEQLKIYGMAAESLLGKKLKELIIYPFSLGKEIII